MLDLIFAYIVTNVCLCLHIKWLPYLTGLTGLFAGRGGAFYNNSGGMGSRGSGLRGMF